MSVQIVFSASIVLVGLLFMNSGQQLCIYGCWVDDFFKHLLPNRYQSLSGGVPWLMVGLVLMAQSIPSNRK